MVGRIGQQHVVRPGLEELTTAPPVVAEDAGRRVLDAHAATEARVAQDGLALVVAVDDVGAERGPADPGLGVHPGVERIGIGLAVGGGQHLEQETVEGGARDDRHGSPPSPFRTMTNCSLGIGTCPLPPRRWATLPRIPIATGPCEAERSGLTQDGS